MMNEKPLKIFTGMLMILSADQVNNNHVSNNNNNNDDDIANFDCNTNETQTRQNENKKNNVKKITKH